MIHSEEPFYKKTITKSVVRVDSTTRQPFTSCRVARAEDTPFR